MKIRITKAGVGKVILQRSDWMEGDVLTVKKYDGDMFVREGWGEIATEDPTLAEPVTEEEAPEAEPETATAEPLGETTMQKPPGRRKGG